MKRKIFNEDHEMFRQQFQRFLNAELVPYAEQWEKDGVIPPEIYLKAGENGFLCPWLPEEYGGSGVDFLYSVIMTEEIALLGNTGLATSPLHSDICVPYIWHFGTEEQKRKYLPGCCTGEYITAIAMSEANTGSDLQEIKTTAVKDGDYYILNGQKAFISNGINNNLAIVAAKTDTKIQPQYKGMSLFLVDDTCPGYKKGKRYEKMGFHSQDTAELIFEDCRVPKSNLLGGEEGKGFMMLARALQQERLCIAVCSVAHMLHILAITKEYISTRTAFGQTISDFKIRASRLPKCIPPMRCAKYLSIV